MINYTLPPLPSIGFHVWYHNWIENCANDVRAGNKGTLTITDALYVQQSIDAVYERAVPGAGWRSTMGCRPIVIRSPAGPGRGSANALWIVH